MPQVIDLKKTGNAQPPSLARKVSPSFLASAIDGQTNPQDYPPHKPAIILVSVIFVLLGLAFLYFQKNIITAIFFFLVVLVALILTFKGREVIKWQLGPGGIMIDSILYHYADLKSFWIDYQWANFKELSIRSKKWYHPFIKIPLKQESPLTIRDFLLQFLPEEKHEDTLVEIISRHLGI